MSKLIFLCGTGRSGTHLVGRSISSHKEIHGRIEERATFDLITKLAVSAKSLFDPVRRYVLRRRLDKISKSNNPYVLEKSHPSLWLYDWLVINFPDAKFIAVYRNPYSTINSMLQHPGVMDWFNKNDGQFVSPFLGIDESNIGEYPNYSVEKKCFLRWLSHYQRIEKIALNDNAIKIDYDNFLANPETHFAKISEFLDVENQFNPEEFRTESLLRFKNELSEAQILEIQNLTAEYDQNKFQDIPE